MQITNKVVKLDFWTPGPTAEIPYASFNHHPVNTKWRGMVKAEKGGLSHAQYMLWEEAEEALGLPSAIFGVQT
jgi:hypothetical protein